MDFIERFFGLHPDGGSGMLEALIFSTALVIAALAIRKLRAARERSA